VSFIKKNKIGGITMNSFVELLEVKNEDVDSYFGENRGYRLNTALQVGDYELSIQASYSHYCTPRLTVPLNEYTAFEVAIFDNGGAWMNPHRDEVFEGFERLEELKDRWEEGEDASVGGYIDKDLVQDLYEYLIKVKQ
jgi:hypothetical protein